MNKNAEQEHQAIENMSAGSELACILLVNSAQQKQARNGPFWLLELKDATGVLEARIWAPLSQTLTAIAAGKLAAVEGRLESYRDKLQANITSFRLLSDEEQRAVDLHLYIPSSSKAPTEMLEELYMLCSETFTHEPWRRFVFSLLDDPDLRQRLLTSPAAKGVHHAWAGGLLEHTLGVCRVCMSFASIYPELDKQTLLAGALCHDLGKVWELSDSLHIDYTDMGKLIGHINLAVQYLTPFLEAAEVEPALIMHLQHLILSHHGQYEFGSPRLPQTPEALALHFADNVDAKLIQCRTLFAQQEFGSWSPYQKTLERALYKAPQTPQEIKTETNSLSVSFVNTPTQETISSTPQLPTDEMFNDAPWDWNIDGEADCEICLADGKRLENTTASSQTETLSTTYDILSDDDDWIHWDDDTPTTDTVLSSIDEEELLFAESEAAAQKTIASSMRQQISTPITNNNPSIKDQTNPAPSTTFKESVSNELKQDETPSHKVEVKQCSLL